jgi:hypothetical protein
MDGDDFDDNTWATTDGDGLGGHGQKMNLSLKMSI